MVRLGQLEGAGGQMARVLAVVVDPRVGYECTGGVAAALLAGAAGEQILVIVRCEAVLVRNHLRHVGRRVAIRSGGDPDQLTTIGRRRAAGLEGRKRLITGLWRR